MVWCIAVGGSSADAQSTCSSLYQQSSNNKAGYYYAGQTDSTANHEGLEGYVDSSTGQSINGATHILNYIGEGDGSEDGCSSHLANDECSFQVGFGQGLVETQSPSNMHGYIEVNGVNGYYQEWYPTSDISGNAYFEIIGTGSDPSEGGYGITGGVVMSGGSYVSFGTTGFPVANWTAQAETEVAYTTSGKTTSFTCATLNTDAYYGSLDNGSASSSTELQTTYNDGTSWSLLGESGWAALQGASSPYSYGPFGSPNGVDAFFVSSS